MNRRRFLQITAIGSLSTLPKAGALASVSLPSRSLVQWRGVALGAAATIAIRHENATSLLEQVRKEIARLEGIFSLYKEDSALSQLNRMGYLENPPLELVALLSMCDELHEITKGAFDPTVQPLWSLYARRYAAGNIPSKSEIITAREAVGWQHVAFSTEMIKFLRSGSALTLNGIAQGYIADKSATLLRNAGITDVLIDVGEIVAVGTGPDGSAWPVEIAKTDDHFRNKRIPLTDSAIATSSPHGTVFDSSGAIGHIFDAETGHPGGQWRQVSVIARSAARADGLSTAFCLMDEKAIQEASNNIEVMLTK